MSQLYRNMPSRIFGISADRLKSQMESAIKTTRAKWFGALWSAIERLQLSFSALRLKLPHVTTLAPMDLMNPMDPKSESAESTLARCSKTRSRNASHPRLP